MVKLQSLTFIAQSIGTFGLKSLIGFCVESFYPDYSSDDFKDNDYNRAQDEAEIHLTTLIDNIKGTFTEWIESLDGPSCESKIFIVNKNSWFINFNYTNTLELLYAISPEKICYIHGKSGRDDLILGHGKDKTELMNLADDNPQFPDDFSREEIQGWYENDVIKEWTREAAVNTYLDLYKNCNANIQNNEKFFNQCKFVNKIFVYGLSFSSVDIPYINHIHRMTCQNNPNWIVSYYKLDDNKKFIDELIRIGIPKDKIQMISLEEITLCNLSHEHLFPESMKDFSKIL